MHHLYIERSNGSPGPSGDNYAKFPYFGFFRLQLLGYSESLSFENSLLNSVRKMDNGSKCRRDCGTI